MTAPLPLSDRLTALRARIHAAELAGGRTPGSVTLLAVSKTFPTSAIAALYHQGQCRFGENYAQEALAKMKELTPLPIEWHFIGHVQSNKTKVIAEHFSWVHSLDRLAIAQRLNHQRPSTAPPLNICIELNLHNEPRKTGVSIADLPSLAQACAQLPRLRLRGLMALPAPATNTSEQHAVFAQVRTALEQLRSQGLTLDTLSMGTSQDMEAAIAAGATMVRIGTALFGSRT